MFTVKFTTKNMLDARYYPRVDIEGHIYVRTNVSKIEIIKEDSVKKFVAWWTDDGGTLMSAKYECDLYHLSVFYEEV